MHYSASRLRWPGAILAFSAAALAGMVTVKADENEQELAKKLANPISSLVSLPIQGNYDFDVGPDNGERLTFNVQPVIPVNLSDDWNLISRTVLPITYQNNVVPGSGSQFGLGDTVQSLFFSPTQPTRNGWIWGAGPAILIPTATDRLLGTQKWAAGPTGVLLRQSGPWTYGVLANHLWSFAGKSGRADISTTLVQPFLSYSTTGGWTYSLSSEMTYDWLRDQWAVPFNLSVSKLTRIGKQPVSVFAGVRYWADSPDTGPRDFGIRFGITLLYPK